MDFDFDHNLFYILILCNFTYSLCFSLVSFVECVTTICYEKVEQGFPHWIDENPSPTYFYLCQINRNHIISPHGNRLWISIKVILFSLTNAILSFFISFVTVPPMLVVAMVIVFIGFIYLLYLFFVQVIIPYFSWLCYCDQEKPKIQ